MSIRRTVRELHAVVAVADHLHFGRAAAAIGMAQPHLSALIRRIETELGFSLFERRPRVECTAAGALFCTTARRAITDLEDTAVLSRRVADGELGAVAVGFASTVMLTDVPSILRDYRRNRPDVVLKLAEMHSADQQDALRSGQIDLAINRQADLGPEFVGEVLIEEPLLAVVPASHALAGDSAIFVDDLAREALVLFRRQVAPSLYDTIIAMFAHVGAPASASQVANEWHTILALVRSGFGVTIAPASVRGLGVPGLAWLDLKGEVPSTRLLLWWSRDRSNPAADGLVHELRKMRQARARDHRTSPHRP